MRRALTLAGGVRGLMRRFCFGATNRPGFRRPGVAYGQLSNGAPKPTRSIEARDDLVPEMFTEDSERPIVRTVASPGFGHDRNRQELNRGYGQTTIDLTSD